MKASQQGFICRGAGGHIRAQHLRSLPMQHVRSRPMQGTKQGSRHHSCSLRGVVVGEGRRAKDAALTCEGEGNCRCERVVTVRTAYVNPALSSCRLSTAGSCSHETPPMAAPGCLPCFAAVGSGAMQANNTSRSQSTNYPVVPQRRYHTPPMCQAAVKLLRVPLQYHTHADVQYRSALPAPYHAAVRPARRPALPR